MSVFSRTHTFTPTVLASALAVAGLGAAAPAHAAWIYARLQPTTQTTMMSSDVDISSDGKTVVFVSGATEWVAGSSTASEVYAYDLDTRVVEIVSIPSTATMPGQSSSGVRPSVSRDGRYVAYLTFGGPSDSGPLTGWQVVRKDRETGALSLVTSTSAGVMLGSNDNQDDATAISGTGRYVAFVSRSAALGASSEQVFLKDMQSGAVSLVSAQMPSGAPSTSNASIRSHAVSEDGRYVIFKSPTPLLPGSTASNQTYVRDTVNNTTQLVSRQSGVDGQPSTAGSDYAAMSPNGRFVTFKAYTGLGAPPNFTGTYMRDLQTHTTYSVPVPSVLPAGSACYGGDVSDIGTVFIQCGASGQAFLWAPGFDPELMSYDVNGNPASASAGNTLAINASSQAMVFETSAPIDPADTNGVIDMYIHVDTNLIDGIFSDSFED